MRGGDGGAVTAWVFCDCGAAVVAVGCVCVCVDGVGWGEWIVDDDGSILWLTAT